MGTWPGTGRTVTGWRGHAAAAGQKTRGSMGTAESGHQPVMTGRVLALLAPALEPPGAILLDATLGRAGHASALLREHPELAIVAQDAPRWRAARRAHVELLSFTIPGHARSR